MDVNFRYKSYGYLHFDPKKGTKHFEPWWALLLCGEGIRTLYAYFLKCYGIETERNMLWGSHVSVIKGHEPENKERWGKDHNRRVEFWYTDQIRWNETHAWVDVFSPEMSDIRESLGLAPRSNFHLTIGSMK